MPLFDPKRLLVLAGPCSLENEKVVRTVAEKLVALRAKYPDLNFVFKGSFDKANRTSIAGGRGTGLEAGLALHALVKKDYGLPCVTDVHESDQCAAVAAVCDVLQIPAYLCRQTDLLLAAAATGKSCNRKHTCCSELSPMGRGSIVEILHCKPPKALTLKTQLNTLRSLYTRRFSLCGVAVSLR